MYLNPDLITSKTAQAMFLAAGYGCFPEVNFGYQPLKWLKRKIIKTKNFPSLSLFTKPTPLYDTANSIFIKSNNIQFINTNFQL